MTPARDGALAPLGTVVAIISSQLLDEVLEMKPVTLSETGYEITSKAGWWMATQAAGAGRRQFTMPLQLPKGTCNQLLTHANGVWKTDPGWRILLVAFGAVILMCGVTVDGMWLHEGAFEGMSQE